MHFRRVFGPPTIAALLLACAAAASNAASSGVAYDELTKFIPASQVPQPGTFVADFQAAVDAAKAAANAPQHHGLLGGLMNMAQMGKNALSTFQNGYPSSYYYLNGLERTDNPADQTATIQRPDRHQVIYLNLAKKTYRVVDLTAQTVTSETPAPYRPQPQGPQPSPQPGGGKLDISDSSSVLGPKTIDNVSTTGYAQDFKLAETQSTGSCHDGTFEVSMQEYVSSFALPQRKEKSMPMNVHMSAPSPQGMVLHPGCSPKTTFHHSGSAAPPSDRIALWTLMTIKGNAQTDQGQMGGGFSTLVERGNIRNLGPTDAGLFDIPSDFTKEQ